MRTKDILRADTGRGFMRPAMWAMATLTIGALAYFAKRTMDKM